NLDLMTRPEFPFALIGLVHIGNTIDLRRPLDLADRFDLTARVEHLRAHERGRAVDVVTTATVDGDVVWQERSSYLHRTRPAPAAPGPRPAAAAPDDAADRPAAHWVVPANIGRAYASVSGDRNPIHTSTIAARLFGFPARIAHGMWAKARCLAALAGRLPEAYTVDVAFKAPILLGATVAYWTEEFGPERRFGLYQPGSGRPHLLGSVTPD
ncbi:MAG TPA: MaoC/PaaZ C-terminal domain-containing protein, partial [Micromonosporaceae bacterium]